MRVFRFAQLRELARARKLLSNYDAKQEPIIAITSPKVFNQPKFRSVLTRNNVRIFVENPKTVKMADLKPWISMLVMNLNKPGDSTTARVKVELPQPAGTLDVSKQLRDPVSGRLNARSLSRLFGISLTEIATSVCDVSKQAISQNPTSPNIQKRLQPLEEVAQALLWCGGDEEKLRAWLRRPNLDFASLEGKTPSPLDLILAGHAGIVGQKVRSLLTGHPA